MVFHIVQDSGDHHNSPLSSVPDFSRSFHCYVALQGVVASRAAERTTDLVMDDVCLCSD